MAFKLPDYATCARIIARAMAKRRSKRAEQIRALNIAGNAAQAKCRKMRNAARVRELIAERRAAWCAPMRRAGIESLRARILMAAEPGAWYGRRDLTRLIGASRNAAVVVLQRLYGKGLLERVANPAYRGKVAPQGAARGLAEPLWLYRMTAEGLARRAMLLERKERGDMAPLYGGFQKGNPGDKRWWVRRVSCSPSKDDSE